MLWMPAVYAVPPAVTRQIVQHERLEVTPARGTDVAAPKLRGQIQLVDVSEPNGFWPSSSWPDGKLVAPGYGEGDNGVFSLNWMDLDGDGAAELFVGIHGPAKLLFKNDGAGNLRLHTTLPCQKLS